MATGFILRITPIGNYRKDSNMDPVFSIPVGVAIILLAGGVGGAYKYTHSVDKDHVKEEGEIHAKIDNCMDDIHKTMQSISNDLSFIKGRIRGHTNGILKTREDDEGG